jgi:RNA polymerase sigma-70 factor, ECF subfamily
MTNDQTRGARRTEDARQSGEPQRPEDAGQTTAAARAPSLPERAAAAFETHRPLLFSIAYRMLGSASEAEDVVQDAWLRYAAAAPAEVRSLRAWLGTVVTRLCLDRLKSAHSRREEYVGPWLPEPVIQADREPSLARAIEQRESVTLAFLVLMESLTPQERAVFVLREAFDYEYDEIAEILELTPANCRQLFHRAKTRLNEHRPRFRPSRTHHRRLVESFAAAMQTGDAGALQKLLADGVVMRADHGGKATAIMRPVIGRDAVTRLMLGLWRQAEAHNRIAPVGDRYRLTIELVNGLTALAGWRGETLETLFTFVQARATGIVAIEVVRNPDKLAYLKREFAVR